MSNSNTSPREQLWDLIKDIKFALFTTKHTVNGHLHSRPMTTQNKAIDEDDKLWFFMSRNDETIEDLASESEVNVGYSDTSKDRYVSVSGRARVVNDPAKTRQLWTKMAEAWFPGGVDDPSLALVQVTISHAHYWDVKESKITQLYKMAKAAITGEPPTDMGESGEVRMR